MTRRALPPGTAVDDVMTVGGPIAPGELGIVLPHEHILLNAVRWDAGLWIDDVDLAIAEVALFRDLGGTTIVDVTSGGLGRNPAGLFRVSEATGVNIVMGAGWYHEGCYPQEIWRKTTNQLADEIVRDLTEGVEGTGIRAGIIGEVGCRGDYVTPAEERVLRAAARAHHQTGRSIITHGDFSPIGLAQLDIFEDEGVDLSRVIVSHCDSCSDPAYHTAVAARGAFVEFDLVRGNSRWETERHIRWIRRLADQGYLDQVLISHDVCKLAHLSAYGGFGYGYLLREFERQLAEAGFDEAARRKLFRTNPLRALTGLPRDALPQTA
jgi:predicted metal-dependent phosphotriesterase family hydrolase